MSASPLCVRACSSRSSLCIYFIYFVICKSFAGVVRDVCGSCEGCLRKLCGIFAEDLREFGGVFVSMLHEKDISAVRMPSIADLPVCCSFVLNLSMAACPHCKTPRAEIAAASDGDVSTAASSNDCVKPQAKKRRYPWSTYAAKCNAKRRAEAETALRQHCEEAGVEYVKGAHLSKLLGALPEQTAAAVESKTKILLD